jgi:hypothetical protein
MMMLGRNLVQGRSGGNAADLQAELAQLASMILNAEQRGHYSEMVRWWR